MIKKAKGLKTLLCSALLLLSLVVNGQNMSSSLYTAPSNLKIERHVTDSIATLNWWSPGTPTWLHFDNGESHNRVRYKNPDDGSLVPFDAAIKYTPNDLKNYNGMQVTKISFFARDSTANYNLRVWTGKYADTIEVDQEVVEFKYNEWNTYELDKPYVINIEEDLYIGLWCNTQSGYPGSLDNSEKKYDGNGDLMRVNSVGIFKSLSLYGFDGNWNISAEIAPISDSVVKPNAFNVYRNDTILASVAEPSHIDNYETGGYYAYFVTAIYSEYESESTDTLTVLCDPNRIEKSAVVLEEFSDMKSSNCVGSTKGIKEMMMEDIKLAPISYHSNNDLFHNLDAVGRSEFYNGVTVFPTTFFDGADMMQRGSFSSSLHKWYKPKYLKFLDMYTPFGLNTQMSWNAENEISIEVSIDKLGIYGDEKIVLHTAIVENNIPEKWHGQDSVFYVMQKMYPDYKGSTIALDASNKSIVELDISISEEWERAELYLVTFIQNEENKEILNGNFLKLTKDVVFVVAQGDNVLSNAEIQINENVIFTNAQGMAKFDFAENVGIFNYSISKDNYYSYESEFDLTITDTIYIDLIAVSAKENAAFSYELFPNPAQNKLQFNAPNSAVVSIFTIDGKKVYQENYDKGKHILNCSSFERGVYVITVTDKKENTQLHKIILTN